MYGICGTPETGGGNNRVEVGLNRGTQSGRNDPRRDDFFTKVKLPGAARYARQTSGARMDFRSYFWCQGADNDFMHTDNDREEHPKNGQRFWSLLEMEQSKGKVNKFRALRAKAASLLQTTEEPPNATPEPVKEDEKKEAAPEKDAGDENANAPVKKDAAEAECKKKGIKKLNKKGEVATAWKSCVEDVQVVGDDEKTKEEVTKAAEEEEKDDEKTEDETEADEKKDKKEQMDDEKKASKEDRDKFAPALEMCPMGDGVDCSKDGQFSKVVSLPAAAFDKKEWNTIKVILPVKAGGRVAVRFRQKETECECCNDFGIDSLQFLAGGEKCNPGSVNEN
jgi:hypothetical protein